MTRHDRKKNGWLFHPFRHFWCGMIYGHDYRAISPDIPYAGILAECRFCGKQRRF